MDSSAFNLGRALSSSLNHSGLPVAETRMVLARVTKNYIKINTRREEWPQPLLDELARYLGETVE